MNYIEYFWLLFCLKDKFFFDKGHILIIENKDFSFNRYFQVSACEIVNYL